MNRDTVNEMRRLYDTMNNCSQNNEYPVPAQYKDVQNQHVPFVLYDVDFSFEQKPQIKKKQVIRCGVLPGSSLPTIDYINIDNFGYLITGQLYREQPLGVYYLTEEDAQKVIDIELNNIKFAKAKASLITLLIDNMPELCDSIQCDN